MGYREEVKRRMKEREKRRKKQRIIALLILALLVLITICFIKVRSNIRKNTNEKVIINLTEKPKAPEPTGEPTAEAALATEQPTEEIVPTQAVATEQPARRGTAQSIPAEVRATMDGKSMKANDNISYDNLSYLTIPHYDFNYNITTGHMVVNSAIAEDVLDIFAELYDIKYPIERMELVDKYNADDFESIEYNNTSCFNYRESTDGTGRLSKHALGRAMDINPQINPYIDSSGKGAHQNAAQYWNRDVSTWSSDIAKAAYIGQEAQIYKIFINHGWEWGGAWSSYKDTQHFQK